MRKSMDRTGRGVVCAPASLALPAAMSSAAAAPTPGKSTRIPFAGRFPVLRHGGIGRGAGRCAVARQDVVPGARPDGAGRATRRLPVCGRYRVACADTSAARHRGRAVADGFQASAQAGGPVRTSGPGARTVTRFPHAKSLSTAGTWGGRKPATAYGNKRDPLRGITVRNGLHSWEADRRMFIVRIGGPHRTVNSPGRAGVVAHDGFRGRGNDARTVRPGRRRPLKAQHLTHPAHAVMAPAGTASGRTAARRTAYPATPGGDSEVFGITAAPRPCAGWLTFRFPTRHPGYPRGALFVRADTRH
ncbi:hypothetical protein [Streptomyces kronopolitis]|uniref:hypothetical protein n=1 Tax=Streptomyces kronopolitis TaxID=1612435 RepID=UPI003D98C920